MPSQRSVMFLIHCFVTMFHHSQSCPCNLLTLKTRRRQSKVVGRSQVTSEMRRTRRMMSKAFAAVLCFSIFTTTSVVSDYHRNNMHNRTLQFTYNLFPKRDSGNRNHDPQSRSPRKYLYRSSHLLGCFRSEMICCDYS